MSGNRASNRRKFRHFAPELELLGSRILPACLTSFSGGLLTIGCNADNDGIYMKSDASGRIYLNGVAIPGNPNVSNTSQISVAGGAGNDKINLSGIQNWNGKATIVGGTGNDILTDAPGRADSLYGGNDNDVLTAGFGNDTLNGGAGLDRVAEVFNTNFKVSNGTMVGLGTDLLSGIEQVSLTGGTGDNTINATAFSGSVTLKGANGNDLLIGGSGNDVLIGGPGDDRIFGNDGNDQVVPGPHFPDDHNSLDGGAGIDTVLDSRNAAIKITNTALETHAFSSLDNLERAFLTGIGVINALGFTLGSVTLVGSNGSDFLWGTPNADSLIAGSGDDVLNGNRGNDTINGGSGADVLQPDGQQSTSPAQMTLTDSSLIWEGTAQISGIERAHLVGSNSNDLLNASNYTGVLSIDAWEGNDTLIGSAGNDTLRGGLGNDSIIGGSGTDLLQEQLDDGEMTLTNSSLTANSEADVIAGIERAFIFKSVGIASIRIDASAFSGPTTLQGASGNDTLIGGSAKDSIVGGPGNDSMIGNAGDDFFDGGNGTDTGIGGPGTDTFISVENQTQ